MAANGNGKKRFPQPASLASGHKAHIAEATVLPSVYQVVQDASEIVQTEVAAMVRLVRQNKGVQALDGRDVVKLRVLVATMRDAHALEGEAIEREGLGKLSREEILRLLKQELASDNGAPS